MEQNKNLCYQKATVGWGANDCCLCEGRSSLFALPLSLSTIFFFFFSFGKYNWVIESRAYILILISRQLSPVPWAVLPFDQIVSQSEFEISFGKEMRIPPILPFCSFDKYLNWTLFCFLYPVSCIISSISIKFAVPWARPITFLDGGIA